MKIVNEINHVVTQRTAPIDVTPADIEKFRAYKSFAFAGDTEAKFLVYLPKVLRYIHAHPEHKGNGAPDIAFEWLKTLSTDVQRKDVPCSITKKEDWMYPQFVGLEDSGVRMETNGVDAFEVTPNAKPEVFAIKPSADGKYYEFYYSISDKFRAETEEVKYYFEYPIKCIRNNYSGDKIEEGLWMALQSKPFNDFTNLDLGGSDTVLYGVFPNKGPIEPLATQFLFMLGGRADSHRYVALPTTGGKLVERKETDETPIVLDNYLARLSPQKIKSIKDFSTYYSEYKDKRISIGVWRDIKWGGLSAASVTLKKVEEDKKAAAKAAEEDAINKAKTLIPLSQDGFIKSYFADADAGIFLCGFLESGLEGYKEELEETSKDDLKRATQQSLEVRAFWHIGKAAMNTITGNIALRNKVFELINRHLKPNEKFVGQKMHALCEGIADTRGWMVHVETTGAAAYIKEKKANKTPISLIPLPIVQAALDEFHDWAANAKRSDLVLVDCDHVQDSMVLTNIARRILAYVPSKKAQEEMIGQLNAQPFFSPKLDAKRLGELAKETKELKKKDAAKKKEPMRKYQLDWSYENVDKDRRNHSSERYKTLGEAKRALCNSYVELRDEINEGGGYFDNHENEIWISDDGMRFGSSGLVVTDYQIRGV